MSMKSITYCEAINQAYREEMARDSSVYLIGEDVGRWGNLYGASKGLLQEFGPDQVKDAPISEAAIAGCAVGSAVMGMRPIAEIMYIDFIMIAMDQMINHAAKYRQLSCGTLKVPAVFRTQGGAGMRNASQHSQNFENWFVNVPGLIVVMPSTPYDVKGLLKSAVRDDNPVVFIEHKVLYFTKGDVPEEDYTIPLGVADVKREGKDVTIIACGILVYQALLAARELEKQGVEAMVINCHTVKPLDGPTIMGAARKTGAVVTVEEHQITGGLGGAVAEYLSENYPVPLKRVGIRDRYGESGTPNELLKKFGLTYIDILEAVKNVLRLRDEKR